MAEFHVRIANDDLVFSAAHFITWGPAACERLHGHSYRVAAEVSGPLDEHQCVVDFLAVRGCASGDHRRAGPPRAPARRARRAAGFRRGRGGRGLAGPTAVRVFPATTACCCRSPTRPRSFWPGTSLSGCGSGWRRRAPRRRQCGSRSARGPGPRPSANCGSELLQPSLCGAGRFSARGASADVPGHGRGSIAAVGCVLARTRIFDARALPACVQARTLRLLSAFHQPKCPVSPDGGWWVAAADGLPAGGVPRRI